MKASDVLALVSTPEKPRGDRVVVVPLVKAGRSFLVDMEENREKPERGVVIAIGPGATGPETGRFVPVQASVGELVAFGKYAGLAFEVNGPTGAVNALIMRDSEILLFQDADSYELVIHDENPNRMHLAGFTCDACPSVSGEESLKRLRELGGYDPIDAAIAAERDRAVQPSVIVAP